MTNDLIIQFGGKRFAAHVGPDLAPPDGARTLSSPVPVWCCPFGKGHRTPRAAATHAVKLMREAAARSVAAWDDEGHADE